MSPRKMIRTSPKSLASRAGKLIWEWEFLKGVNVVVFFFKKKTKMIRGHFPVDMKMLKHTYCLVLFQAWIDDALEYCMHSSSETR